MPYTTKFKMGILQRCFSIQFMSKFSFVALTITQTQVKKRNFREEFLVPVIFLQSDSKSHICSKKEEI